jgi:hypothetical protein
VTKCHGLKLKAKDGKMRVFDMFDTETLFRLIQSIPSPKAEPFKLCFDKAPAEDYSKDIFIFSCCLKNIFLN